jgi:putative long chain acyl-CoA synthase
VIADPDTAGRVRAATSRSVLVLGIEATGDARALAPGVVDLEQVDPAGVALPSWYRPDPGRARDLAIVFVAGGRHEPLRAQRITNRRWAFSALGAAAAATLTTRDTVYCCLPLHHPSGTLVAVGSALIGGARLALATEFDPQTFWDEVRRYGVSVVYYAGEMCRRLIDAPAVLGEANHPVRLFAGSGMRVDAWRRLVDRFGPVAVCELYASTEAHVVLANTSGKKLGSVGRPLPGSPEVAIVELAAFEAGGLATSALARDGRGSLVRSRLGEPGMLVAKLGARAGADVAHIDPRRLVRDAFEPGDTWFVTGDVMSVDAVGDYAFVDRPANMIATAYGTVASTRVEDALYACPGIALCVAVGCADPEHTGAQVPIAAIVPSLAIDLDALAHATLALPEYARPRRIRVVDALRMTDGFRPIKRDLVDLDAHSGVGLYRWDTRMLRYV